MANPKRHSDYFAPEINSPLIIDESNTFDLTMSTSTGDHGKAPMGDLPTNNVNGASTSNIVTLEPARQSELQVWNSYKIYSR